MRVYIIDPCSYVQNGICIGHYFGVASNMQQVLSSYFDAHVAGGPIYGKSFKTKKLILPYNTTDTDSVFYKKWKTIMNVKKMYQQTNDTDLLIWQSSSVLTTIIGIFLFGKKNSKTFLIQYNARCMSNAFFRLLFALVRPKLKGIICTINEVGKEFNLPYHVIPDYIYTAETAGEFISYQSKEFDFCVVGLLCHDKGIEEVIQKIRNTKYRLLVAGKPADDEFREKLIKAAAGCSNIILKLEYLPDDKYDYYIRHSKYCLLNYKGAYSEHSSGVVCDVIFKGTPVVGTNCKSFSFVKDNGLGLIYNSLEKWNPESILDEKIYMEYVDHIKLYYDLHKQYKRNLINFLSRF